EPAFGLGLSAEVDSGDVDLDGDLDVAVADGDEGIPKVPRLFINDGTATFTDETATRFAGFPTMNARDIEFFDAENDGDLDVYLASTSPGSFSAGKVSRFFLNLGGAQLGALGYYAESTDSSWGALVAVPSTAQLCGGCNAGPFRDFSCDCDFGDLDDDGDSDLFFGSYGPGIDGSRDSRVFLNDGAGVFNELWPWAHPAADTKMHAVELDLADFDGDFDLDVVVASRNSQSRVFLNNRFMPIGEPPFTDITGHALLGTGAFQTGQNAYETEFGDADGDGDFDVWMTNYNNNTDRLLRNNGPGPGGFDFTQENPWIKGDPITDEEEADFGDYDDDGDLDVFVANFSGTNFMYQSSLAQGLDPETQGLYHRNGVATGLAPQPELPSNFNGGSSYDGEWADLDGDGDLDILLINNFNQGNWLFRNVLGVPDTHAPGFATVTVQGDKPNGTDTVIHASVRDNAPLQSHRYYGATLVYTVDGVGAQGVAMLAQGGQQYRGEIPAQIDASIEYHVEVTDLAGNIGVSDTHSFTQGTRGAWTDLGSGLAGVAGIPSLVGTGPLTAGSAGSLTLSNAAPSSVCALFVSLSSAPAPFKCGTLVPVPVALQLTLVTNGSGALPLAWGAWPSGLSGASLYFQYAIADGAAVCGTSLSNALRADVP
ncbi:MAG TPA: VCBS repeat-containing protein, partial [Ilumatobacteraceae bacterium]|nr:VCBS repeat-containing protein [Ilumatobacteraceae bacterium]